MRRLPPHAYFAVSAVFHYLGPAFAVLLFVRVGPLGTGWLRIAAAAVVLAAWRRPWSLLRDPTMLQLGGVYALTGIRLEGEALGLAFAFANAGFFALYIVLGHRVAQGSGLDGLAASMAVALVAVTPLAFWDAVPALDDPVAIAAGVGVGLASSVIPYVCDQLAMARLPRATYALLVSLLPATATVIGIVVLAQIPSPVEVLGVSLVVAGVALHRAPRPAATPGPAPARRAAPPPPPRAPHRPPGPPAPQRAGRHP